MSFSKIVNKLNVFYQLSKVKVTASVTLTTILGYVLFSHQFSTQLFVACFGVFMLACGSAALNHYQDRKYDALMERTNKRPIPANKISAFSALTFAIILISFGEIILFHFFGVICFLLGMFAVIWYNGIYTPLKRKTAFAVIPGAIIGAIPVLIGWSAAGANYIDYRISLISFFCILWQIPHFWLLLLKYGSQYNQAGYPTLQNLFSTQKIKNITFVWILSTTITAMFFPVFLIVHHLATSVIIYLTSIFVIIHFIVFLIDREMNNLNQKFMTINIYVLIVFLAVVVDLVIY